MGYKLSHAAWPACLKDRSEVSGVYVGGCIIGHDARFWRTEDNKHVALAHSHIKGKHTGWICVPYKTRLRSKELMLHELAHLIVGRKGHGKMWRKTVKEVGGTLKSYQLVGSTLSAKCRLNFIQKLLDLLFREKGVS